MKYPSPERFGDKKNLIKARWRNICTKRPPTDFSASVSERRLVLQGGSFCWAKLNQRMLLSPLPPNLEMIASTATCSAGSDQAGCMQNKSFNDMKISAPAYTTWKLFYLSALISMARPLSINPVARPPEVPSEAGRLCTIWPASSYL
jgi:hypothetical protein